MWIACYHKTHYDTTTVRTSIPKPSVIGRTVVSSYVTMPYATQDHLVLWHTDNKFLQSCLKFRRLVKT